MESRDDKQITVVSRDRLTKRSSPHPVFAFRVSLNSIQISLQISESIWIAVSQVNSVFIMFELALKSKSVVIPLILTVHAVLVITNVGASSDPTSACLFSLNIRIEQRPHSMIIQRVRLNQVNDVKPIVLSRLRILNSKVIPLSISPRVVIRLEDQVVLVFVNLNSSSQVATFKS